MASVRFQLEGFAELRKRAAKLDRALRRKVYTKAVKAGGKIVKAAAESKVPFRTGATRRSVVVRTSSKPADGLFGVKVVIKDGQFSSQRTANRRRRGSSAWYGGKRKKGSSYQPDAVIRYYRFQELGTKYHPAQPFLKPSLEGQASQALAAIKRELNHGIEEALR